MSNKRRRDDLSWALLSCGATGLLPLAFTASGAERNVFDRGIYVLAFGQPEFGPGFQRHARKQTRAVALLAQRYDRQHRSISFRLERCSRAPTIDYYFSCGWDGGGSA
jgi:hypothetical protein